MRRTPGISGVAATCLAAAGASVLALAPAGAAGPASPSAAAAISAHAAGQPQQRQIGVTTLTHFKVVLTATRGGPRHRLQATVTAKGYRRSDGHWTLIAAKQVGPVNGWEWFSVATCSLTATQFKPNAPSPPFIPFDSMKASLVLGPALGCSATFNNRWTP
jgi:hypothetical protein